MVKTMNAAELVGMDTAPYTLLDVREPMEYGLGTLRGAVNAPFSYEDECFSARAEEVLAALPKDREVIVFCHSGPRSEMAAEELDRRGFTATDVPGGYRAYQRALYAPQE